MARRQLALGAVRPASSMPMPGQVPLGAPPVMDYQAQMQDIARRRAIAQQMAQPQPRIEQAGGYVVPYSLGEGLAGLGSAFMARQQNKSLDKEQQAAQQTYQTGRAQVMKDISAAPSITPDLADRAAQYNISPDVMAVLKPKRVIVPAGGALVDETSGAPAFTNAKPDVPAKLPDGMRMGENGQPEWIPGYLEGKRSMTAQGQNGLADDERALAAELYQAQVPAPGGGRGVGFKAALRGVLDAHPDMSPAELAANIRDKKISLVSDTAAAKGGVTATVGALTQNDKLLASTSGYLSTLEKNLGNLVESYDKLDSTRSPIINRAVRNWQQGVTGDPETAAMVTWLNAVQGEYAKLKSGSLGNAPASDAAMHDAKEVINKYMSTGGIKAVKAAMEQEGMNRVGSIKEQSDRMRAELSGRQPAAMLPAGVTEDDIQETMRANKMTRQQVLDRLNAR